MTDNVHPINPSALTWDDEFEPICEWQIPDVYHRPTDFAQIVRLIAGFNPASGETLRLGEFEFTKDQARHYAAEILAAVDYLDAYFVYEEPTTKGGA